MCRSLPPRTGPVIPYVISTNMVRNHRAKWVSPHDPFSGGGCLRDYCLPISFGLTVGGAKERGVEMFFNFISEGWDLFLEAKFVVHFSDWGSAIELNSQPFIEF